MNVYFTSSGACKPFQRYMFKLFTASCVLGRLSIQIICACALTQIWKKRQYCNQFWVLFSFFISSHLIQECYKISLYSPFVYTFCFHKFVITPSGLRGNAAQHNSHSRFYLNVHFKLLFQTFCLIFFSSAVDKKFIFVRIIL